MVKNIKKDNALIKRKNLVLMLKEAGIARVSPEGIRCLEEVVGDYLEKLIGLLKEEMAVQGRKTLKEEDVEAVLRRLSEREGEGVGEV